MKKIWMIMLTLMLVSCLGPESGVEEDKITGSSGKEDPHSVSGEGGEGVLTLKSDIAFKNYAQYNMNLSKSTGVSMARVNDVYLKVKNSMPSTTDPNLFNSFTLLSYTRLSFEYCSIFVDEANMFSATNFDTVDTGVITDGLINYFLTQPPSDKPNLYDPIRAELSVIFNDQIQDDGRRYVASVDENSNGISNADQKKRLTVMACTALLASSYFTTM